MTGTQKHTAQTIITIFETGKLRADHGIVSVLAHDHGLLSYGRIQVTLASGHLGRLIAAYCQLPGAQYGSALAPYVPALRARLPEKQQDRALHALLRRAGDDPLMQQLQNTYTDERFWDPACMAAHNLGITLALGVTVVYDSFVHGNWWALCQETNRAYQGMSSGERAWVRHYIATRWAWLARHQQRLLRKTTYRMETLSTLAQQGNWHLTLPITIRGVRIGAEDVTDDSDTAQEVRSRRAMIHQALIVGLSKVFGGH